MTSCISLFLQDMSHWHLALVSLVYWSWRYPGNSTHRVTFPCKYSGWNTSQLKSFVGFFISGWCTPMLCRTPGLSEAYTWPYRSLDANHLQMLDGPGYSLSQKPVLSLVLCTAFLANIYNGKSRGKCSPRTENPFLLIASFVPKKQRWHWLVTKETLFCAREMDIG